MIPPSGSPDRGVDLLFVCETAAPGPASCPEGQVTPDCRCFDTAVCLGKANNVDGANIRGRLLDLKLLQLHTLPVQDKIRYFGKSLLDAGRKTLQDRLPPGWSASLRTNEAGAAVFDVIQLRSPDKRTALLVVDAKTRVFPRDVAELKAQLDRYRGAGSLLIAPFLSRGTQRRLREVGQNYLDLTGNIRVAIARPGLYVETIGAAEDPSPPRETRRSLKGAKAGRLVRALCDYPPPFSLSDLASKAGINVGYASRLVAWLAREDLITGRARGAVDAVDRVALIRRWADDYDVLRSNVVASFLDPRGLSNTTQRLFQVDVRYAVTGSLAASKMAPIAPPRLAMVYVSAIEPVAEALKLRPAETGINVMLLLPFDDVVFERTSQRDSLTLAAPSQVAADLMTSPGRGPSEAEALLQWMKESDHSDA